jgi:CTP:molybdopterin cytidylyltransferase MocA
MKYTLHDHTILVDGEPVARVELLAEVANDPAVVEMISAANRGAQPQEQGLAQTIPALVNDLDETGAATFLAAHDVPIISPDIGAELIRIVKRLEVVQEVYPLPPTLDVYRLALYLVLQVAAEHQRAFCEKLEKVLGESD